MYLLCLIEYVRVLTAVSDRWIAASAPPAPRTKDQIFRNMVVISVLVLADLESDFFLDQSIELLLHPLPFHPQ